jgi:hypothetical protein
MKRRKKRMGCTGSTEEEQNRKRKPRKEVSSDDSDDARPPPRRGNRWTRGTEKLVVYVLQPGAAKRRVDDSTPPSSSERHQRALRRAPVTIPPGERGWFPDPPADTPRSDTPRPPPLHLSPPAVVEVVRVESAPSIAAQASSDPKVRRHTDNIERYFLQVPHRNTPRSLNSSAVESRPPALSGGELVFPSIFPLNDASVTPRSECCTTRSLTLSHELPPIRRGPASRLALSKPTAVLLPALVSDESP